MCVVYVEVTPFMIQGSVPWLHLTVVSDPASFAPTPNSQAPIFSMVGSGRISLRKEGGGYRNSFSCGKAEIHCRSTPLSMNLSV